MAAFEEIKAMLKAAEETQLVQRQSCPECGWSLDKHKITGILHCRLCGWTDELSQRQEVY